MNFVFLLSRQAICCSLCVSVCVITPSLFAAPFGDAPTISATQLLEDRQNEPDERRIFTIEGPEQRPAPAQLPQNTNKPLFPQPQPERAPIKRQAHTEQEDAAQDNSRSLRLLLATIANKQALATEIARQSQSQWQAPWYLSFVVDASAPFVWPVIALGFDARTQIRATNKQSLFPAVSEHVHKLYFYTPYQSEAQQRYQELLVKVQQAHTALQTERGMKEAYAHLDVSYRWFLQPRIGLQSDRALPDKQFNQLVSAETANLFALIAKKPEAGSAGHATLTRMLEKKVATFEAQGEHNKAIAWSHHLLAMRNSYQHNATLARLYEQQGSTESALYYLGRLNTMRPSSALNKRILSLSLKAGKWQQAQRLIDAMAVRDANNPTVRAAQARIYAQQQNWSQANDIYTTLLHERTLTADMQTKWALQHLVHARTQQSLGLRAQATALVQQSLELMPTAEAYALRAQLAHNSGDIHAALESLAAAYQQQPTDAHGRVFHTALASYANRLAAEQKKTPLSPQETQLVAQLALLDTRYDARSDAIITLYRQQRLRPAEARRMAQIYLKKAQQLFQYTGKQSDAQAYAQTASSLAPHSSAALRLSIDIERRQGNRLSAVAYMQQLLQQDALDAATGKRYAALLLADTEKLVPLKEKTLANKNMLIDGLRVARGRLENNERRRADRHLVRLYATPPVSQADARILESMDVHDLGDDNAPPFVNAARSRFLAGDNGQAYDLMNRALALGDTSVDGVLLSLALALTNNQQQTATGLLERIHQRGDLSATKAHSFALMTVRMAEQQGIVTNSDANTLAQQLIPVSQQQSRLRALAIQLVETEQYQGAQLAFALLPNQQQDTRQRVQALLGTGNSEQAYQLLQETDALAPDVRAHIVLVHSRFIADGNTTRDLIRQAQSLVSQTVFIDLVKQAMRTENKNARNKTVWLGMVIETSQTSALETVYKNAVQTTLAADTLDESVIITMPTVVKQDTDFMQTLVRTALDTRAYQVAWMLLTDLSPDTLNQQQKARYATDATELAQVFLQRTQYQESLSLLTRIARITPTADVFVRIGDIEYLQANVVGAYVSWRKAVELNPRDAIAKERARRLAFVEVFFAHQQDRDKTIQTLEEQAQERPNDDARKLFLSQLYEQRGQKEEQAQDQDAAKLAYKKALAYQPRVSLLLRLAEIAREQAFWNEAIYYTTQAARQLGQQDTRYQQTQRDLFFSYEQYAEQFYKIKHLGNAAVMLQKALQIAQANPHLGLNERSVHAKLYDYYTQLGNQPKAKLHAKLAGIDS